MSGIKPFYADQHLFVTGGTGFVGKVLIEKLLRSFPDLKTIFLLIRPKKGINPHDRLMDFGTDKIFDTIRSQSPSVLSKIRLISGDISSACLGISASDRKLLIEQVTIVFHVAATVRFNEGLHGSAVMNTLGTLQMMQLCSEIKGLKSVVYVSTAYCSPKVEVVEEIVYQTSDVISKDAFVAFVKKASQSEVDALAGKIMVRLSCL